MPSNTQARWRLLVTGLLCAATILPAAVSTAQYSIAVSAGGAKTDPKKSDHAQRCLAAVDLAIMAAEAGIMDVSIEAMDRACKKGPPVASIDLGGILSGSGRQPVRRSSSSNNDQQAASAEANLAKRLQKLHEVWVEKEVDPQQAYTAWKNLILPPGRPNEAFSYSTKPLNNRSMSYRDAKFEPKPPKPIPCGVGPMVHWAREAGRLEELRKELDTRKSLPGAAQVVLLARAILDQDESTPVADVEGLCDELSTKSNLLVGDPSAELLFGHVWGAVNRLDSDSPARNKLIDAVVQAIPGSDRWLANPWLVYLVDSHLTDSVDRGDIQAFQGAANLSMSRYDEMRNGNAQYVSSREAVMYSNCAKRAFDKGHVKLGTHCLKAISLRSLDNRYGSPRWGEMLDPNRAVMKSLAKMPPAERLDTIGELVWTLPMLGLRDACRRTPTSQAPELFTSQLDAPPPSKNVVQEDQFCYSLLQLVMRDALATGRRQEVEQQIAELEKSGSDDAQLAKLVLSMAGDGPLDLAPFIEDGEEGSKKLVSPFGQDNAVTSFEIELLRRALADEQYREPALALLKQRKATAIKRGQRILLGWLNRLEYEADKLRGNSPATHRSLKHWVVANDTTHTALRDGRTPEALWIERDHGAWGQQCCGDVSYMLLRYPLSGDFTISLRHKDGAYIEGGAVVGGNRIEFLPRSKRMVLNTVGGRGNHTIDAKDIKANETNDYRIVFKGGKLTFYADDKVESAIGRFNESFPFFASWNHYFRSSTFDSLKIEGSVEVPRTVDMASPTLMGWTARFRREQLAPLKVDAKEDAPTLDLESKAQPHWSCTDGVIESLDMEEAWRQENPDSDKDPYVEKRRESLLQYLRPLCDGEQVELEFYYEPGKFSLAPSVGRIAMLLDQPDVALHWVTANLPGWTGLSGGNRATDPDAKQTKPISLKENEWNSLSVRIEGGVLALQVNGQEVYQRRWEAGVGREFGLFHDPSGYQVRVRNLKLSGDWPETLPADFFEKKPEGTI